MRELCVLGARGRSNQYRRDALLALLVIIVLVGAPAGVLIATLTSGTNQKPQSSEVSAPPAQQQSSCIGALEEATGEPGVIRAIGWADGCGTATPSNPLQLHVDLDGQRLAGSYPANQPRLVSHLFHGFDITIPAAPGRHHFCVSAYDYGADQLLRCTWVTVP